MTTEKEDLRLRTLKKYQELNEQLRDFLKHLLMFEKSSIGTESIHSTISDQGGISLLSVKNDLLFHYLMNLVAVMHRRSTPNQSLTSPTTRSMILRLCEIRTYIEKLRPIEQKLQYQMDKLLKNNLDEELKYRANLDNFDENLSNGEEENENENGKELNQPKIYRPPKLVPMEFPDEFDAKKESSSIDKRLEHKRRQAYHSDVLEEYKQKYSDAPEEIYNTERSRMLQKSRAYKEKIAYEEDYLKRLPQTKKERLQLQRSMVGNENDVIEHLDSANILFDENFNSIKKTKKQGKMSRKTKKRLEKRKKKLVKRFKSKI